MVCYLWANKACKHVCDQYPEWICEGWYASSQYRQYPMPGTWTIFNSTFYTPSLTGPVWPVRPNEKDFWSNKDMPRSHPKERQTIYLGPAWWRTVEENCSFTNLLCCKKWSICQNWRWWNQLTQWWQELHSRGPRLHSNDADPSLLQVGKSRYFSSRRNLKRKKSYKTEPDVSENSGTPPNHPF